MRTSTKSIATHTLAVTAGASLGATVVGLAAMSGGSLASLAYTVAPNAVKAWMLYRKRVAAHLQMIDREVEDIWSYDLSKLSGANLGNMHPSVRQRLYGTRTGTMG